MSLLFGVFLAALASGWHCMLMCSGIAVAIEPRQTVSVPLRSKSQLFYLQCIMHLGRLTTYVLLGALAAFLGMGLWQQNVVPIQRPMFAFISLILIWMAVGFIRQPKRKINHSGGKLGLFIAKNWATYLGSYTSQRSRWFSGILWGLVPCALIYCVLPLAFLSGSVFSGAALMLAFGLGTLPNLLLMSKFSATLSQFGQSKIIRYLAATLLLIAGTLGLYRAWTLPSALLKSGFCFS